MSNERSNPLVRHVGLLLAAGAGTRFGGGYPGAKLDRLIDGVSVGVRAFESLAAVCDTMIVVARDTASSLAVHACERDAVVVVNRTPERGLGSSIAEGIKVALAQFGNAQFAWALMADMPFIEKNTFMTLCPVESVDRENVDWLIVQPQFAVPECEIAALPARARAQLGLPGHPVVFGRNHWQALAALDGDQGAKQIIEANRKYVIRVPLADEGIWKDIDEPSDLGR